MAGYIFRRFLQAVPVFFGTTLLIYYMTFVMPGDPIVAMFGRADAEPGGRRVSSAPSTTWTSRSSCSTSSTSAASSAATSASPSRASRFRRCSLAPSRSPLRLAIIAIVFQAFFGILVGLVAGLRKGKLFDANSLAVGLILISLPIFVIAFVAQYVFGIWLGWARTTVGVGAPLQDLILPGLVLASASFAQIMRLTRDSVIETSGMDFVRTAYSKGLSRTRIIPVHILRNSLIPVVTYLAVDFGVLLVGATITEGIFNVPGVGNTLFQAILRGENPTVVSFVTIMVLLYLAVNLVVDLFYGLLDPRIRYVK